MALSFDSVAKKLLWGIAFPALLVGVGGVWFCWHRMELVVTASTRDEAAAVAEIVSTTFETAGPANGPPHPSVTELFRSRWKLFRHVSELRVLDASGVVRWSRDQNEVGRPPAGPMPELGAAHRAEISRPLGGLSCANCHAGESAMQVGILQLAIDQPSLAKEVASVFKAALWSMSLFILVCSIAAALSLHFSINRPLKRLAEAMGRAEEGDFLARAETGTHDELGALGAAFNRMLARITSMKVEEIDAQRDLVAAQAQLSLKEALETTNSKLETRVMELSTLYGVAKTLNATLALPDLFARIATLVPSRLKIPQFSIMLLNKHGILEVKTALPTGRGTEELVFAVGEGACGRAAARLESVYIPDVRADTEIFQERGERHLNRKGALLCLPMIHKGKLLGVLNFERPEKASFDSDEIELLTAVADQVAVAVKNAQLHEEMVELSVTDPLTGVPNRRHLFSQLEMEVARAKRFSSQLSVLMIDIDHFKKLNDAAGHRAGDEVLRAVAELMQGMVRKVDTLARYGGEEFMILLPRVAKAEALEVAQKLRRSVEEMGSIHRQAQPGGRITISVGTACLPADATEEEALIDCVDSALYASKRGGRNRVTAYEPGMELHPGRERGPHSQKLKTGEFTLPKE